MSILHQQNVWTTKVIQFYNKMHCTHMFRYCLDICNMYIYVLHVYDYTWGLGIGYIE